MLSIGAVPQISGGRTVAACTIEYAGGTDWNVRNRFFEGAGMTSGSVEHNAF